MVALAAGDEIPPCGGGIAAGGFVPVLPGELEGGVHGFAAGADEEGFGKAVGGAMVEEERGEVFGGGGGVSACVDV